MGLILQQDGGECETCGSHRTHTRYLDRNGEVISHELMDNDKVCPQCGCEVNTINSMAWKSISLLLYMFAIVSIILGIKELI